MIETRKLMKSFGSRIVLRELDLQAGEGEIIALIGRNGVGKTTLLRLLAMLTQPEFGSILLDGKPFTSDSNTNRQRLGVVLHSPMLYTSLTAYENLLFFCRLYNLPDPKTRINHLLSEMELSPRSNDQVHTFSRGMQQRLSLSRALLHDPACLLLDEPYTGLDQSSVVHLNALLKKEAARGKTILFATHDLERLFPLASRVDLLHQGRIAYSSSTDRLTPRQLAKTYETITSTPATPSMGNA